MDSIYYHYKEAQDYLESLSNLSKSSWSDVIDKNILLERTRILLKYFGNPEKNLQIIHVGGTAGKGSVSNLIQYQLKRNNLKVGVYVSPHATTIAERIKINDELISADEYVDLVNRFKIVLNEIYSKENILPSYFEILTVLSLVYFAEKNCDYVVLEVGLGGTYDSTNVVDSVVSVITNIGLDHMEILGDTKEKIAVEKAGIIKENIPIYTSEKFENIRNIFKDIASQKNSPYFFVDTNDYEILSNFPKLEFKHGDKKYSSTLLGQSQITNIILASKVVEGLGFTAFTDIDLKIPCRLEILSYEPLIIIDGAHNEIKFDNLISLLNKFPNKKKHLIFAIAENKEKESLIKKLCKEIDNFYLTRYSMPFRKVADMNEIKAIIENNSDSKNVEIYLDSKEALNSALKQIKNDDILIISGSFYLAGELRNHWQSELEILNGRSTDFILD